MLRSYLICQINLFYHQRKIILQELQSYLNQGQSFEPDPRQRLFSHDERCESKIIPIKDFEDMENRSSFFPRTITFTGTFLKHPVKNVHICCLSPRTDFNVVNYPDQLNTIRFYFPLLISSPRNMSGVWLDGIGVRHFSMIGWRYHPLNKKHNVFNYSRSNIYIFVFDVDTNYFYES